MFKSLPLWWYGEALKLMEHLERLHQCWKGCAGFGVTCSHLHDIFHISAKQCQTTRWTPFQSHWMCRVSWNTKKTQDCWAARILYQTWMGQRSSQRCRNYFLQMFPDCRCDTAGNVDLSQLFIVAAVNFKITNIFHEMVKRLALNIRRLPSVFLNILHINSKFLSCAIFNGFNLMGIVKNLTIWFDINRYYERTEHGASL